MKLRSDVFFPKTEGKLFQILTILILIVADNSSLMI